MNTRVHYGKNTPLSFREDIAFHGESPYEIRYKEFANEDVVPLHYADTLEIGVCCGITGDAVIGHERLTLSGNLVYVVSPGVVHATTIHKGPGHLYVMHISPEAVEGVLGLGLLLRQSEKTLSGLPALCPQYDRVLALVTGMIRRDHEPIARTRMLLELFEVLSPQMPPASQDAPLDSRGEDALHRVLCWTQKHFPEPICLEDAAAVAGFTRNYFCTWFRGSTGSTYMRYLNEVRIQNACRLLAHGGSVSSACYDSGFRDMSYFIQLFKKMQGCTPKNYVRNTAGGGRQKPGV